MNLKANLSSIVAEKLKSQPDISFKDLIEFANAQEPVTVRVRFNNKLITSDIYPRTACSTFEAELPVLSYDGKLLKVKHAEGVETFSSEVATPTTVRWEGREYLASGGNPPYGIDLKEKRLKFLFGLPSDQKFSVKMKWWQEVVARVPELKKENDPFLIVESTAKGLRFSYSHDDYKRSPHKEVKGTSEELAANPFSKIFSYPSENLRIQMPQSCY